MRLSKNARHSYSEVIQVDSYEMVAALRHLGFAMPRRQHWWVSEEIAEDFIDEVTENSVYIYPRSERLMKTIELIKSEGININKNDWLYCLDEVKVEYGVGPSKIENFSMKMLPNGRFDITSYD